MSYDDIRLVSTLIGTFIAAVSLLVGAYQYRRSVHIEIFRKYAEKYNSIITPDNYKDWLSAIAGNRELWDDLKPTMVRYLNLVWEECFLHENGIMPPYLWRLWLPEILSTLNSDFAKETIAEFGFHFPPDLADSPRFWRRRLQ